MGKTIRSITGEEYADAVTGAKGRVLLDIWGDGCPPCQVLAKVLEQVAEDVPGLTILKMNFADGTDVAVELGVMGLPTLCLFEDGELLRTKSGAMSKAALLAWLDE